MESNSTYKTIQSKISEFDTALTHMSEIATAYIDIVDQYNSAALYDASILKQRMKDAVMRVVTYES